MRRSLTLALFAMLMPMPAPAEEPVDWEMVNRIRDEGLHRSEVMATLEHLTDVIGPRLTGSPADEGGQRVDAAAARRLGARKTPTSSLSSSGAAGRSAAPPCTSCNPGRCR